MSGFDSQKKTDDLTDMRDFGEFLSLSLEYTSVVAAIQFVCSLYQENKGTSNNNGIFTKKNVSGDLLPSTLDILVFHMCKVNYQTFIWKSISVPVYQY